ncbi:hypothetical protein NO976_01522 [Planktothrix agardhii]|uniref:hypothetical protein n=1 Tax=Planktothrix agardhii TaxID=1160 RepID=UPI0020A7C0D9|nr:hypothetical protein [Planktothrix agardhii]CAD5933880.1 hypothetical protein NO976_01522 [Planktothrix agardhii]
MALADFFITEEDVLQGLDLQKPELEQIISAIEKEKDKFVWEEETHFRYVHKGHKKRDFSRLALIVIGEYFETNQQSKQATKVLELLTKKISEEEKKQIDLEIVESTLSILSDNSSKILLRRNRYWINFRDVLKLLKTNTDRLEQAFEDIARSDLPLIIEVDFEDIEDDRHYSFSGLERISLELSEKLTDRLERLYAARVHKVAIPIIKYKATPKLPLKAEIDSAIKAALKKQKNQCQITGESMSKTMTLAVHHLYNKSTYPELAAEQDNLLVIKQEIHQEFHCWHEGYMKPCTISDFRLFIEVKYSSNYELLTELNDRKRTLETKLSSKFLALPASSPTPTPTPVPIAPSKTEPSKTQETNTTSFSELETVDIISKGSINRDILGKATFATIDNQKVKGKILATSSLEQKRVCFQIKEGELGIWLPESAFINE